ncbi:aldo/keto reductase family protein [Tenggerimyces flavus]|uniref:Aldo/keto reductase family protein n=1 Tax=Tenggerimyces flavus TaxID=1708749 RepID=A0ABV7YPY2_9ACTN|nr:aldo/keto reductase family protein [Tenggerimyces flavus]MBM7784398.1 aryl-alcohol dehydrogenase-like predicted oxidoreductase [Tenggerimyces flavus]
MDFRHLGSSGLYVSEIAYGNWLTHGEQIDQDAAEACVHAALDVGITTFDTADVYAQGQAETVLGRSLRGVRRESVEICTKVHGAMGDGLNNRGLSRKHVMEACHASLKRLDTEYVDLYQAHRFDGNAPLEETLIAFDDLVRQGKVLYLGVSEWTASQIADALRIAGDLGLRSRIVSNQPQYNLLWRVIEAEVLPLCEREGIGQVVFSPLAQGVLSGKYQPGSPPPEGSRAAAGGRGTNFIGRVRSDEITGRVAQLASVAADAGLTMAQLAVAWVLQNPGVSAAIIGASRPEQIKDNAGASGVKLEPAVLERIDEVLGDDLIERDPSKTAKPFAVKDSWAHPDWKRPG